MKDYAISSNRGFLRIDWILALISWRRLPFLANEASPQHQDSNGESSMVMRPKISFVLILA